MARDSGRKTKSSANGNGGDAKKQLVGLRRGVEVVRLLAANTHGLGFGAISDATDLPDPTLARLLKVLTDMQLVDKVKPGGLYRTGGEAVSLARLILGHIPSEQILQPVVDALANRTGESSAYFELDGDDVVLRSKKEHADSFHYMAVYGRTKKWVHGFTQAPMAFLSEDEVAPYRTKLPDGGAIPAREWKRRMGELRENKLYVDDGESNRGAIRITAPVFLGPGGRIIGSIGVTVLSGGLSTEKHAWFCERVVLAGRQATERLASFGKAEGTNGDGR